MRIQERNRRRMIIRVDHTEGCHMLTHTPSLSHAISTEATI